MTRDRELSPALRRIIAEDAVGQLQRREGRMAELGSENGELKLDWVEAVARLLADEQQLEQVEQEARELWQQGIRHLIWAGMGGSVITVRVLVALGFGEGCDGEAIAIYPLDSTDPAALNAIVHKIAQAKHLPPPVGADSSAPPSYLKALLNDVMMVGVSMGMTSEEPITHLQWFTDLLVQADLTPSEHLLVMTLPGSYLDRFAREQHAPSRPLQLDGGTGTGGRMSAPGTRVFLLPAALFLTRQSPELGQLRRVLRSAWTQYDFARALAQPAEHPYVQLGAALAEASLNGACRLLLDLPEAWRPLLTWIEQLLEESLGKGHKGVVAFAAQSLNAQAPAYVTGGTCYVLHASEAGRLRSSHDFQSFHSFILEQPAFESSEPGERLAALAASFLGWQLAMALFGYLQDIPFAGQPAVENYKARARALRSRTDPLQEVQTWPATARGAAEPQSSANYVLLVRGPLANAHVTPAALFVQELRETFRRPAAPGYLDCTYNGEAPVALHRFLATTISRLGNEVLGIPVKLRQGPADYHSTEQGEMDGPPTLVSLRLLTRQHDPSAIGSYSDTFLLAQAISTWQAMCEQGRACSLLIVDGPPAQAQARLERFFQEVFESL